MTSFEYPPFSHQSGLGTHTRCLAQELARLGHTVVVVSTHYGSERVVASGPVIVVLYDRRDYNSFEKSFPEFLQDLNAAVADRAPKILRELRFVPDVVHSQACHMITAAQAMSHCWGCPLIGGVHISHKHMSRLLGNEFDSEIEAFERTLCEAPDQLIAVSAGLKAVICQDYGLAPAAVRVVHNGVNTRAQSFRRWPRRALRARFVPGADLVAFIGGMSIAKGLPSVLASAGVISQSARKVQYVLAGSMSHSDRKIYENTLASDLRLRSSVRWIRNLRHTSAMKLAGLADVVVVPSAFEACPYVALEAMVQGTPVIASNTGGMPEIIEDGVSGFLVPLVSGVPPAVDLALFVDRQETLLSDPVRAQAIGRRGRRWVMQEFDQELMARRTAQCYEAALGSRVRG